MKLAKTPKSLTSNIKRVALIMTVVAFGIVGFYFLLPSKAATTNGTGGEKTDQTNLSYKGSAYTSEYHLYAGGLDWTKPVGMLIYADGSGEYGLKNLSSDYLMAGSNGMIAVAKRHNMILLTPLSPNKACSDGDGSCWYLGDSDGYTTWAKELVLYVQSRYPVDTNRIAFGGYSSGAELATTFWVPSGAAQLTMTDGVIVAISYGSVPRGTKVPTTADFKAKVHMSWNSGEDDPSYSDVMAGYNNYTAAGFDTSLELIPGLDHDRDGQFGAVMEAEINKWVGDGTTPTTPPPTTTSCDTNGDKKINLTDLSILLSNWAKTSGASLATGDCNGSQKVDLTDLSTLLSQWSK